jgi:hypothetical protein
LSTIRKNISLPDPVVERAQAIMLARGISEFSDLIATLIRESYERMVQPVIPMSDEAIAWKISSEKIAALENETSASVKRAIGPVAADKPQAPLPVQPKHARIPPRKASSKSRSTS